MIDVPLDFKSIKMLSKKERKMASGHTPVSEHNLVCSWKLIRVRLIRTWVEKGECV